MASKSIVATVVCRYGHDGARAVTGQHIIAYPDGNGPTCEWVYGVSACENAANLAVGNAFAFGSFLRCLNVGLHFGALFGCGKAVYQFAFGSQHHESNAEDGVGASGKDGETFVAVFHGKLHFGPFRATNPVALRFFQRVGPVHFVQSFEQTLCIRTNAKAPLAHLFLHNGVATTHTNAVNHFVVGQHRAQFGTPVHHRFAQISNAIVHQRGLSGVLVHRFPRLGRDVQFFATSSIQPCCALFGQSFFKLGDGQSALLVVVVIRIEHLLKRPLRPFIICRVAGAYLAAPIKRKTNAV